jgi:hypothetical protein
MIKQLPRRERWAYTAVFTAVLVWFGLDTAASLRHGAWFNVVIVNVPCLILLGIPLLEIWRRQEPGEALSETAPTKKSDEV